MFQYPIHHQVYFCGLQSLRTTASLNQEILELHIKILRNFFKIRPREIHVYSDGSGTRNLDILEELKIVEQNTRLAIVNSNLPHNQIFWLILHTRRNSITGSTRSFTIYISVQKICLLCNKDSYYLLRSEFFLVFTSFDYVLREKINNFHECALFMTHQRYLCSNLGEFRNFKIDR